MKGVKKILFTLIIIGLCLTPFFYSVKADYITIHGAYYANIHQGSDNYYYVDITIVTDNDSANGSVTIGTMGTFNYRGQLTYISEYRLSGSSWGGGYSGTFTQQYNQPAEVTSLDSTQLTTLLNAINSINTTDQSILSALNSIKNEIINNLDTYIDTISWKNINSTFNGFSNELNGTYTIPDSSGSMKPMYIYFTNPNVIYDQSAIYKVTVPYTINKSRIGDLELYVADSKASAEFYWYSNARKLEIYIFNIYSSSNLRNVKIKINTNSSDQPIIYYPYSTYSFKVEMIDSNDIEYWTLLNYFTTNNSNYNNELNNANSKLEPAVNDYIDQEDDLINDFDTAINDSAVDPSSNIFNPSNFGNTFIQSIGFVGSLFNSLVSNNNPFYLMINFSLMLGLALLVIGKRA